MQQNKKMFLIVYVAFISLSVGIYFGEEEKALKWQLRTK